MNVVEATVYNLNIIAALSKFGKLGLIISYNFAKNHIKLHILFISTRRRFADSCM